MRNRAVTITLPAARGALLGDLPEFEAAIASFTNLIDVIDVSYPRRVPKRLIRALHAHREDLIGLGELRLVTAAIRVT